MSNSSILVQLESQFERYLLKKINTYDFGTYLVNSIQALEAVDYETILIARDFQYKFEITEFSDEDSNIEDFKKVAVNFREWLKNLIKQQNLS